eukprot:4600814-Prymnesium_polylepis.1
MSRARGHGHGHGVGTLAWAHWRGHIGVGTLACGGGGAHDVLVRVGQEVDAADTEARVDARQQPLG